MGRVISIRFNYCHIGKLRTLNRSGLSRARVGTLYVQKMLHTQLLNLSDPPSFSIFTLLECWGVLVLEPDSQPKRGGEVWYIYIHSNLQSMELWWHESDWLCYGTLQVTKCGDRDSNSSIIHQATP